MGLQIFKYGFGDQRQFRDFSGARLRYAAARYDAEARLNQSVASIYELQVRKNNISAERHRQRSGKFFFGMLAAQLAVIVATYFETFKALTTSIQNF